MKKSSYYLRVNGVAATRYYTKKVCLEMAEHGHKGRPDAVVELVEYDCWTNTDTVVARLYN